VYWLHSLEMLRGFILSAAEAVCAIAPNAKIVVATARRLRAERIFSSHVIVAVSLGDVTQGGTTSTRLRSFMPPADWDTDSLIGTAPSPERGMAPTGRGQPLPPPANTPARSGD